MLRSNVSRVVLLTFFARLHFYLHASSLFLVDRGLSLFEVNALDSIVLLSVFLAEVPTGIIADRIGRKWSVMIGLLLHATGEGLVLFGYSFPAFAVMCVLIGTGFAFQSGATESLIYDTLPEEGRENAMKRAMGSIGGAGNLGFVISPLLGSLIVAGLTQDQFARAIVLTASSIYLAALFAITLKEPPTPYHTARPHPLAILRGGLGELRESRPLQRIAGVTIFLAFGGALISLVPPHFVVHDAPTFLIGASLAFGSLLASFTQKYAYVLESLLGRRAGLVVATILPGVLFLLLALASGAYSIFGLVVLIYGVGPMRMPLMSAYQNAHISSGRRATVLSLINMLATLWSAIGSLIAGALADRSIPLVFVLTGGVVLLTVAAFRVDKIPLEVPPSPQPEIGK
jgi:DHA1 family quinolone resistance protein-like MFS transporter